MSYTFLNKNIHQKVESLNEIARTWGGQPLMRFCLDSKTEASNLNTFTHIHIRGILSECNVTNAQKVYDKLIVYI